MLIVQFTSFTSPVFNSKPFFFALVNETIKEINILFEERDKNRILKK